MIRVSAAEEDLPDLAKYTARTCVWWWVRGIDHLFAMASDAGLLCAAFDCECALPFAGGTGEWYPSARANFILVDFGSVTELALQLAQTWAADNLH